MAECPLFPSFLQAVFPSSADDYVETTLDLNKVRVDNETSTFFVRVSGHSMKDIGIRDGDIIVVDHSIEPSGGEVVWGCCLGMLSGDVVVAALDGEFTAGRYRVRDNRPL